MVDANSIHNSVSNDLFLRTIFGEHYPYAHVTSFTQDPSDIPTGESGRCWAGGWYKDTPLIPNSNQFYTVSRFSPDERNRANRRKANFSACYVVALDDVKEKLPIDQVMRLPAPSIVLKSSLHSEQWLYLLIAPETNADRIDNLHDGLIANGLAPDGKDPGQKGVTRYLRLPEGCNTKAKRIAENSGAAPRCEITEWHPERRYTLEQLAEPFGVDLDAPRTAKSDGAATVSDHPLLHTPVIKVKQQRSDGRYEITCPWVDEHTGAADNGAAIFTNVDGTIGFRCHHGSCEHRTGGDLLQWIEGRQPGFTDQLKHWQVMRDLSSVAPAQPDNPPVNSSPWETLSAMGINDHISILEQRMLNDRFVLKDMAILGQWSVFYAAPNTGKTLLTLWLLRETVASGEVNGKDVYYSNCDDTTRGGLEKGKIARDAGFTMLVPNENGFKVETLLELMRLTAESGEANGKVLVVDTLKKFAETNDKKLASKFGKLARGFVQAGGTLICLAHVNKHLGMDGKSVYSGTADIRDDADCCYTIESLGTENHWGGATTYTVQFENNKARGDVAQTVAFQYVSCKGAGYQALFDSVTRVGSDIADAAARAAELEEQKQNDAAAIEAITTALTNDKHGKTEIVEFVIQVTDVPRNRVRTVLQRYEGQLWDMTRGQHNICFYSLRPPRVEQVSFL